MTLLIEPTPTCGHSYCQKGLFHDGIPLHTHRQCHNCHKMARFNHGAELRRCTRCFTAQYCSPACQKAAWHEGHKDVCKFYSTVRTRATELSGDPRAWEYLMSWVRFHHSSISNAALASCIHAARESDSTFRDVTEKYYLQLSVVYRNDASLPDRKKFELRGTHLVRKNDPTFAGVASFADTGRIGAIKMGKKEFGRAYAGTGSYLIIARFGPPNPAYGTDGVPFVKHFGIDNEHTRVRPAYRSQIAQLAENVALGTKMRFCCGRSHKDDSCCCSGGWTHALMESAIVSMRSMNIHETD